jgi:hypothetical protein
MKVLVTNHHGDPIYRLGIEFPPHDEKEITIDDPNHLRILEYCRFLSVKKATKKKADK